MRGFRRLTVMGLVNSLFLILAPLAQADDQQVTSSPNGDLTVHSGSGADTDKDKDGDFNTLTHAVEGSLLYAVFNNTEAAQTVHITVVLDGPGTARDATLVDEDVVIGPSPDAEIDRFEFKVKRKDWPAGTYSLSVIGSGSETATAVSTFTIAYK
jgi:hypothetical protein